MERLERHLGFLWKTEFGGILPTISGIERYYPLFFGFPGTLLGCQDERKYGRIRPIALCRYIAKQFRGRFPMKFVLS